MFIHIHIHIHNYPDGVPIRKKRIRTFACAQSSVLSHFRCKYARHYSCVQHCLCPLKATRLACCIN